MMSVFNSVNEILAQIGSMVSLDLMSYDSVVIRLLREARSFNICKPFNWGRESAIPDDFLN